MPIDYERAKREFPKQKAVLTRALNQTDPEKRHSTVAGACRAAVRAWDEWGAGWWVGVVDGDGAGAGEQAEYEGPQ